MAVLAPGSEKFNVAVGWRATAHQLSAVDRTLDRILSDPRQFGDRRQFRRALRDLSRRLPQWRHEGKHETQIAEMYATCCNLRHMVVSLGESHMLAVSRVQLMKAAVTIKTISLRTSQTAILWRQIENAAIRGFGTRRVAEAAAGHASAAFRMLREVDNSQEQVLNTNGAPSVPAPDRLSHYV